MADERKSMLNEAWWDFYKLFTYSFEEDPLSKRNRNISITGAGTTQPDAVPDLRQDGSYWSNSGSGTIALGKDSNDLVDLSTVQNRGSRYKEYDRLRSVAEIEQAMQIFADEACVSGDTLVATPYEGLVSIKYLAEHKADKEFAVYCWDFSKNDYTIGTAFAPRLVKREKTVKLVLDNGTTLTATTDHRVLLKTGKWICAGEIKTGDELMPFYRVNADQFLTKLKTNQFPRIYTFSEGWVHERQFVDEWRLGKKNEKYEKINQACRMVANGLTTREIAKLMGHQWVTINSWLKKAGFSVNELKKLGFNRDRRRVIGIRDGGEMDVYDLSVKEHHNFCTDSLVVHNCQIGEHGNIFEIECDNDDIKEELEWLMFDRQMLNMNRKLWKWAKDLFVFGDKFMEVIINPDNPKDGILKLAELPPESMFRIETTKGKLIEFQQSNEQPDYDSLQRTPVGQATESELAQAKAIRFAPHQIIHLRIGDDRKTFFPYGVSLIEAARGPAHQLRLMEDAMLVYRLIRAPERRVFYIDVGNLPPFKAQAFMDRIRDEFRKKKVSTFRGGPGASSVEERWNPQSADEDFWIPMRTGSNTRVETLPGAQNLGEIDDALYFRNKLLTALGFPKNYFASEDPNATRITLSAQDVKFARMIERLQASIVDGLYEILERHLKLRGYPPEAYEDLKVKMTPPSDWRELSRAEVVTNRINNANGLKGSMLMADYDILTKWMKYSEEETQDMLSRLKFQKLEDLKLQVLAQNPQLLGVGIPGQDGTEIGTETGGPNPMLGPDGGGQQPPPDDGGGDSGGNEPPPSGSPAPPTDGGTPPSGGSNSAPLPQPSDEDIKKFDLGIQDYASEQDAEEVDYSEM